MNESRALPSWFESRSRMTGTGSSRRFAMDSPVQSPRRSTSPGIHCMQPPTRWQQHAQSLIS